MPPAGVAQRPFSKTVEGPGSTFSALAARDVTISAVPAGGRFGSRRAPASMTR